jgi:hypothetical protein
VVDLDIAARELSVSLGKVKPTQRAPRPVVSDAKTPGLRTTFKGVDENLMSLSLTKKKAGSQLSREI